VYKLSVALGVTVEELMDTKPADEKDQVFFREYKQLKPETKNQLKKIMEAIKNDGGDK